MERVEFHTDPRPERITQVDGSAMKPLWQLTVGVVTQTVTPSGLKIIPTREVTFEIADQQDENHWVAFGLDPGSARAIAARLNEFANVIESDWSGRKILPFRDPNLPAGA